MSQRDDLHVLSLVLVIDEPKSTFNCWKMFPRGGNNHNIYLRQITIAKFLGRTLERNLQLAIMNKYRPETHNKIMKAKFI
jgi:hypothetical protein